ncbi:uncharacterized protein LOC123715277 isoform X1 [Pieris brassicae]|uniref:uncharacterized protein LOC123715277 isoform X1 n=1 Tax=Pieris brassicae TaxID=7116 RepID=UPI001E65EA11|nr:uncharacterized protein LOC123715277 isoform X1 [Pieris brassicae]
MLQSEFELTPPLSSPHTCEDSVENIIRKYSYIDRSNREINKSNFLNNSNHILTLKKPTTISEENDHSYTTLSNNRIFDDHLYDFIANYCKEEIRKEVDLKVSSNSSKNSTAGNGCQKEYVDKATYCRPVFNLYNREFIFKTLERNAKLTHLIQELITSHQREKQNEVWNNFIDVLKSKHNDSKMFDEVPVNEETLGNGRSSQFNDGCHVQEHSCVQSSKQCKGLLDDIYGNSNEIEDFIYHENTCHQEKCQYHRESSRLFLRYPFCYPTSSVGRLTMLHREDERLSQLAKENKIKEKFRSRYKSKYNIHVEEDKSLNGSVLLHSKQSKLRHMTVQTEHNVLILSNYPSSNNRSVEVRSEERESLSKNITNMEEITQKLDFQHETSVKSMTLKEIENKLELLINSINRLIGEFTVNKNIKTVSKQEVNNHFNHLRSVVVGSNINKKCNGPSKYYSNSESILPTGKCSIIFETPRKESSDLKKINEIFSRELGDNASSNKTCAVQITFEVPTKETSTEVTKSLSKAHLLENDKIEEIIIPEPCKTDRITIAVNTDPLNILTLLRISTQAMKRFLSFMPHFDYYYYLSRFYLPQLPSTDKNFICNICGAKFPKASELSYHIQEHDLGKAKECCVCRHVLDLSHHPVNIYSCCHCGQCFVRAYCCELHQKACGRRLGNTQGVTNSNLLILR